MISSAVSVEAFTTDWRSVKVRTSVNVRLLEDLGLRITVVPEAPFSAQWNSMVSKAEADLVVWLMGDVAPPARFEEFVNVAIAAHLADSVASYAPNLNYTSCRYDPAKLRFYSDGVYHVPATDMLLVVLDRRFIQDQVGPLDVSLNRNGWMLDYLITARARRAGSAVLRDYRYLALHPEGSDYDMSIANDLAPWLNSLTEQDRVDIERLRYEVS